MSFVSTVLFLPAVVEVLILLGLVKCPKTLRRLCDLGSSSNVHPLSYSSLFRGCPQL